MRRPTMLTMRSMMRNRCASFWKTISRLFQPALALDVHLVVAVDEDVGDRRIRQQRFQRAKTEDLVEHVEDQRIPLE